MFNTTITPVAASEDPEVKVLYDSDYLYILYQVVNANFSLDFSPSGGARDPAGTGFGGDDFELFIAPGGNMADDYYHIVFFPNPGDSICYVWDEFNGGGATSWNGSGDQAAFTYDSGSSLLTMEYRIPWTAFNNAAAYVPAQPSAGTSWGVQIGYINNNPSEAVNWEPDTTAGFAAGRPFGTWTFAASSLDVQDWTLY